MKSQLMEFLEKHGPKKSSRLVAKNPQFVQLLNEIYPGVPLSLQLYSFRTDTSPFCQVCGATVKSRGKLTCSHQCREVIAARPENLNQRLERYRQTNQKK